MRWRGQRESSNIEDRRNQGGLGGLGGARQGRMPRMTGRRGGLGLGTIVIGLIVAWLLGINPMTLLSMYTGVNGGAGVGDYSQGPQINPQIGNGAGSAPSDDMGKFVSVVLASTEDVWAPKFKASGSQYPAPDLVLFTGATRTACGQGSAASGPFYCPADRKVYIDLSFFQMMHERLGAPGDFAQAYDIAHDVGHPLQNITVTMQKMDQARLPPPKTPYNQ